MAWSSQARPLEASLPSHTLFSLCFDVCDVQCVLLALEELWTRSLSK